MKSKKFPTKKSKNKAHLEVHFGVWSIGLRVLEEPFFLIPFMWWMILFPTKSEERWSLERLHYQRKKKKKNGGLEMGFKKMGFKKKWLRTQRSEKMFREMNESKLGSLGRWFPREEMVKWGRKCKWKKRVNSDNGGREKSEEGRAKKKKKTSEDGGQKLRPPPSLPPSLSYLSC